MQLLQIELTNYCCHASKTVVFDSGFIGLVGGNGTGKSSILDGIRFALVGESANDGVKKSNIRSNAPARAPSNVKLRLTHNGRTATITRNLRPASPARIVFDNETTDITGEDAVTSHVLTWLGITEDLLASVVCAAQEDLFGFANMTPGVRAKFFQALFGLEHLQGLRKKVQEFIAERKLVSYDTVLASTDEAVAKYAQELADLRLPDDADAKEEESLLRSAEQTVRAINDMEKFLHEWKVAADTLEALVVQGRHAAAAATEAETAFAEVDKRVTDLKQLADNANLHLKAHSEAMAVVAEFTKATQYMQNLQKDIAEAQARVDTAKANPLVQGVPDPAKTVQQAGQQLAVLMAKHSAAKKAWEAYLATPDVCPTCTRPIDKDSDCAADLEREYTEATTEYQQWQNHYTALETAVRVLQMAESNLQSYTTEQRYKQDTYATLQKRHDEVQNAILSSEQLQALADTQSQMQQLMQEHAVAKAKHDAASQTTQQLRGQYTVWSQKMRDYQSHVLAAATTSYREDPAQLQQAKEAAAASLQGYQQRFSEKLQKLATRQAILTELQRLQEQKEKILAEEAKQQAASQKYAMLQGVVDLLHSDTVPKYIATQNLDLLQVEMNRILGELSAKFRLKAEDDLTLVASWEDGRSQPLSRLSGGQKTVVAAVFRIAMSTMFTNNIGFLVLDEPTAFQDREHIAGLIPALEALERYAENTGMQLIVVTHEPLLHPVFKRLIDLSA